MYMGKVIEIPSHQLKSFKNKVVFFRSRDRETGACKGGFVCKGDFQRIVERNRYHASGDVVIAVLSFCGNGQAKIDFCVWK